ncbi:MAG: hypothetical protein UU14_C0054G0005 [Candidatus Roizmanbacteria bacterium GW2011_GWB1_40_7]|uniref:Uncharacterized protein n=2 Tax=Candidatus Roizmaniibacteriota TaxID=1752723 RepID=A0A0G0ZGQ4_9BACT|nr:MAG: hypothetical protein UU14_C0054G0005 [Candidatus Roizmanbacteria bacterium GW2011_GWB1_40_7]KKS21211.1 MAG: hypothetical protein UU78_C0042G0013 [Candidatus Roizmanbacteria bacterium GW2011_GWC2_41_7]
MLKQQLRSDLNNAMREKDSTKVGTIRLLLSAIQYFEIQKQRDYQASDEEIVSLIKKEVKKRKESIALYKQGKRDDLVEKETKELAILQAYLPEQMSEDEVRKVVTETIQETNASSMADMGRVMASVMSKLKGKVDGSVVNKVVREELS